MVARKMSSQTQSIVAKPRPSASGGSSRHVDRFLAQQLLKLQLQRRIDKAQILIPRMDLYHDDNLPAYFALFEVPGISEERLRVDVLNGYLTVEGKRGPPLRSRLNETLQIRAKTNEFHAVPQFTLSDEKYLGRELNFGAFRRRVLLPPGTQARDVRHSLKDGMLLVTWPKQPAPLAEEATPTVNVVSIPTEA